MQRESAAAQCTPHFLSVERKRAVPVQKKGVYIASEQLEELQCLPIALPIARQSRVGCCYTIWLCSYYPLLRSRWRLCRLTDAAHPLRVPLCQSRRSVA